MEQESVTKGTGQRLTFTASVSTYVSIILSRLLSIKSEMDKYILQQSIAMLGGSSFRGQCSKSLYDNGIIRVLYCAPQEVF